MKFVAVFYLLFSFEVISLTPLNNIMLGKNIGVEKDDTDPFFMLERYNELLGLRTNFSREFNFHQRAVGLNNFCATNENISYLTKERQQSALKSYMASYRYLGLKYIIKNIVELSKAMELGGAEFQQLTNNLVGNFCSENLSVISKKQLNSTKTIH